MVFLHQSASDAVHPNISVIGHPLIRQHQPRMSAVVLSSFCPCFFTRAFVPLTGRIPAATLEKTQALHYLGTNTQTQTDTDTRVILTFTAG